MYNLRIAVSAVMVLACMSTTVSAAHPAKLRPASHFAPARHHQAIMHGGHRRSFARHSATRFVQPVVVPSLPLQQSYGHDGLQVRQATVPTRYFVGRNGSVLRLGGTYGAHVGFGYFVPAGGYSPCSELRREAYRTGSHDSRREYDACVSARTRSLYD